MKRRANILLIDIENFPNTGLFWDGMYEQNIISITDYGQLLSFAYKWLGEDRVYAHSLNEFKTQKLKSLLRKLHEVMSMADIIIAHNGNAFDIKKANAYFIRYGFKPLPPRKQIDTLLIAKRYFKFPSNKLTELGKYLGLGVKVETGGFKLWQDCYNGKQDAWKRMIKYNKYDVVLLEMVYLKMLPWVENHPNLNVLTNHKESCPNCSRNSLQKRGKQMMSKKLVQRYQCMSCGTWTNENKLIK